MTQTGTDTAPQGSHEAAFRAALQRLPLIAILRGLTPQEAPAIGDALWQAGFRLLEVPLTAPGALDAIGILADRFADAVVGAGTVVQVAQVQAVVAHGGRMVVSPNWDPAVVAEARANGLSAVPGVATPSEAFAALHAGASALKVFPAEAIAPEVLRAWHPVMPLGTVLLPVGGIVPDKLEAYCRAGAGGFGLGSALYRPGDDAHAVAKAARRFVDAWEAAQRSGGT